MRTTLQPAATLLAAVVLAAVVAILAGQFIAATFDDVTSQLESIQCNQWGGRFNDPCDTNR